MQPRDLRQDSSPIQITRFEAYTALLSKGLPETLTTGFIAGFFILALANTVTGSTIYADKKSAAEVHGQEIGENSYYPLEVGQAYLLDYIFHQPMSAVYWSALISLVAGAALVSSRLILSIISHISVDIDLFNPDSEYSKQRLMNRQSKFVSHYKLKKDQDQLSIFTRALVALDQMPVVHDGEVLSSTKSYLMILGLLASVWITAQRTVSLTYRSQDIMDNQAEILSDLESSGSCTPFVANVTAAIIQAMQLSCESKAGLEALAVSTDNSENAFSLSQQLSCWMPFIVLAMAIPLGYRAFTPKVAPFAPLDAEQFKRIVDSMNDPDRGNDALKIKLLNVLQQADQGAYTKALFSVKEVEIIIEGLGQEFDQGIIDHLERYTRAPTYSQYLNGVVWNLTKDLRWFLMLEFVVLIYYMGFLALLPRLDQFNSDYKSLYNYAMTPLIQGGLGKSSADAAVYANLYAAVNVIIWLLENNVEPVYKWSIVLMSFALVDMSVRASILFALSKEAVIQLDQYIKAGSKRQQWLLEQENIRQEGAMDMTEDNRSQLDSVPLFIEGHPNIARDWLLSIQQDPSTSIDHMALSNAQFYHYYLKMHTVLHATSQSEWLPNVEDFIIVAKHALLFVLAVMMITNAKNLGYVLQEYQEQYNQKYNALAGQNELDRTLYAVQQAIAVAMHTFIVDNQGSNEAFYWLIISTAIAAFTCLLTGKVVEKSVLTLVEYMSKKPNDVELSQYGSDAAMLQTSLLQHGVFHFESQQEPSEPAKPNCTIS